MPTSLKLFATAGCHTRFFISDSHLDCVDHWDYKITDAQPNPDGAPCLYCRTWGDLQFQVAWKWWLDQDWQLKHHSQSSLSLFSSPLSYPSSLLTKAGVPPLTVVATIASGRAFFWFVCSSYCSSSQLPGSCCCLDLCWWSWPLRPQEVRLCLPQWHHWHTPAPPPAQTVQLSWIRFWLPLVSRWRWWSNVALQRPNAWTVWKLSL